MVAVAFGLVVFVVAAVGGVLGGGGWWLYVAGVLFCPEYRAQTVCAGLCGLIYGVADARVSFKPPCDRILQSSERQGTAIRQKESQLRAPSEWVLSCAGKEGMTLN